jgi:hypothetical protein
MLTDPSKEDRVIDALLHVTTQLSSIASQLGKLLDDHRSLTEKQLELIRVVNGHTQILNRHERMIAKHNQCANYLAPDPLDDTATLDPKLTALEKR